MEPSLRLWKLEDPERRAIPFLVSTIIGQKGGFRNVSEDSLEEEIATGESQIEDIASPEEKQEVDEKPRAEQVDAARLEILGFTQSVTKTPILNPC